MPYSVKSLHIYPVKALGSITVDVLNLREKGAQYDRRYMLVDNNGRFISQRDFPILATLRCSLDGDAINVSSDNSYIHIPIKAFSGRDITVQLWKSSLKVSEVAAEVSEWFSDYLGQQVRLVGMTSVSKRMKYFGKWPFSSKVSLADAYPYLVIGDKSMQLLNSKLDEPLSIDRFRPNIVVATKTAHEEDAWQQMSVRNTGLKMIKPCPRCVVTTIDQDSGDRGKEPLMTLSTYRKNNNKIYFGMYAVALNDGPIHTGEKVNIN